MGEEEEEDVGKRQPVGPNETGVKKTRLRSKVETSRGSRQTTSLRQPVEPNETGVKKNPSKA